MDIGIKLIIGLLSVLFVFASSIKILGWQKMIFEKQLEFFHSYGLNRKIMALVGVVELFGATTIWFQSTILGLLGALAIFLTSAGAICFHLRYDTWKDGIAAMLTLSLSSIVIVTGKEKLFELFNLIT